MAGAVQERGRPRWCESNKLERRRRGMFVARGKRTISARPRVCDVSVEKAPSGRHAAPRLCRPCGA